MIFALALTGCPSTPPATQCQFNTDCDAPLVCSARFCRSPCNADTDCVAPELCVQWRTDAVRVCLKSGSTAVCSSNECASGRACVNGLCASSCVSDADCAQLHRTARCNSEQRCAIEGLVLAPLCDGGVACNGRCVDVRTDRDACGVCGNTCGIDQQCVDGSCVTSADAGR